MRTQEQRAVVLARGNGSLKFDDVGKAMRSCYPEFVVPKKRSAAAHYLEHGYQDWWNEYEAEAPEPEADPAFDDVELFLAEHDTSGYGPEPEEAYQEHEVAEVLAASWKDRRAELNKLQKARKFHQAGDVKRQFRVEVEELKKRTQCRRCGKTGHWARECRSNVPNATASTGAAMSSSGASLVQVQDFVCSVQALPLMVVEARDFLKKQGMLEQLRAKRQQDSDILLVSSPGYAILDSGCGRSVIGTETLQHFRVLWDKAKVPAPRIIREHNSFRFGNGEQEVTDQVIEMPIQLAGRRGVVRAAIIKGKAPLLMSRPALKMLGATMDFATDKLKIFDDGTTIDMMVNEAGQYMISVADFELTMNAPMTEPPLSVDTERPEPSPASDVSNPGVAVGSKADVSESAEVVPGTPHAIAEVVPMPPQPLMPDSTKQWNAKQWRQFRAAARDANRSVQSSEGDQKAKGHVDVVEVFSPPGFAKVAAAKGLSCISADLITGWDFRKPAHRDAMKLLIKDVQPTLLVLSEPCSWQGGWYHLNKARMDPDEVRVKQSLMKLFTNFCLDLAQIQIASRRRLLLEHSRGSAMWRLPRLQSVMSKCQTIEADMCCFGAQSRRELRFLVSHADMRSLEKVCPGNQRCMHRCQGNTVEPNGPEHRIGRYPVGFLRAVLRAVKEFPRTSVLLVQTGSDQECLVAARVAELNLQPEGRMKETLLRLHANLGHPPNAALCRVLKHGGATAAAQELAKTLECDVCKAQKRPETPPPAQTERSTRFNAKVGLDIKYLPGWRPNMKIPALNILDFASSFQLMIPLPHRETSQLLRSTFMERWASWAGTPEEIVIDPAQANLSDAFTAPLESAGARVSITAADAHWQLGKVEVHGGWFSRVLERALADNPPQSREAWLECVQAAHCKNELIQVYGMTPAQFVFGRNPRVPQNLLDEPLEVVPATTPLYEESVARAVAVRQSARQAVVQLQDSKALRLSLAARPRRVKDISLGILWLIGELRSLFRGLSNGAAVGTVLPLFLDMSVAMLCLFIRNRS